MTARVKLIIAGAALVALAGVSWLAQRGSLVGQSRRIVGTVTSKRVVVDSVAATVKLLVVIRESNSQSIIISVANLSEWNGLEIGCVGSVIAEQPRKGR